MVGYIVEVARDPNTSNGRFMVTVVAVVAVIALLALPTTVLVTSVSRAFP